MSEFSATAAINKNSKNLLQEHFQKLRLQLPSYSTSRIDHGTDNSPIWKSFVKLENNTVFDGVSTTKRDAELVAAQRAYEHLVVTKQHIIAKQSAPARVYQKAKALTDIKVNAYKTVLLVDGENCDFDIDKLSPDILILIFASKNTTKKAIFNYQANYQNCYVFISESVGRDAADHLLTYYAGKLSILYGKMQYYVLTKDHYGEFLERFMDKCKFICSIDELIQ